MLSRQPRLFDTYTGLFEALLGAKARFGFCDRRIEKLHTIGEPVSPDVLPWMRDLDIPSHQVAEPGVHTKQLESGQHVVVLEMRDNKGRFLGALAVEIEPPVWQRLGEWATKVVAARIEPGLQVLHRELVAQSKLASRSGVVAERAQELEWLFGLSTSLTNNSGDDDSLMSLLEASCERIGAMFGALLIPEKRVSLMVGGDQAPKLAKAYGQAGDHLLKWVQRSGKPLVVNSPAANAPRQLACRLLAVPIVQRTGRAIGLLVFLNSLRAREFVARDLFLARHLGRQVAPLLEMQFDATTGLYTRAALERQFGKANRGAGKAQGTVIYVDIDRLHVINDVHGFEIGDEVIVRIAELLGPPLLASTALAARVSGDRFAVVLQEVETDTAVTLAMAIQGAASQITIGPAEQRTAISLSCGIAELVDVPQALARALAAAELACKTAKDRGRGRVEVYAVADSSMMRRQDDVIAVGRLRAALQADRMVLFAQPIVSLQDPGKPAGYEILVRLRDEDGSIVAPGHFISAAQRYQLLPSIDRWVMERAFRQLAPFASMLLHRGLSMSINVSGQSIGDSAFMHRFLEQLGSASIAPATITVEMTEQTTISNLPNAVELVRRLRQAGCRFALDDFGTGSNSLTYLKGFPVTRVKIDGSFVRDILTNARSEQTVLGIVQMAKGMSLETVAEFVENMDIARKVKSLGVEYAQGYAYGKPEPLADILRALQEEESRRGHRFEFDI
ncbi:MAG: EAL domain-containing protein [Steroidobacteraceae bacterium]